MKADSNVLYARRMVFGCNSNGFQTIQMFSDRRLNVPTAKAMETRRNVSEMEGNHTDLKTTWQIENRQ